MLWQESYTTSREQSNIYYHLGGIQSLVCFRVCERQSLRDRAAAKVDGSQVRVAFSSSGNTNSIY